MFQGTKLRDRLQNSLLERLFLVPIQQIFLSFPLLEYYSYEYAFTFPNDFFQTSVVVLIYNNLSSTQRDFKARVDCIENLNQQDIVKEIRNQLNSKTLNQQQLRLVKSSGLRKSTNLILNFLIKYNEESSLYFLLSTDQYRYNKPLFCKPKKGI